MTRDVLASRKSLVCDISGFVGGKNRFGESLKIMRVAGPVT